MGDLKDWLPLLTAIAGGLIVYIGQRSLNLANATSVNVETFRKLIADVATLSDKVNKLEAKNTALWQYVYELLEAYRKNGKVPPSPPLELETDPKLTKVIKELSMKVAG